MSGFLKIGPNQWPVGSFADASRFYELMRDEYHEATQEVRGAAPFPSATLSLYGRQYTLSGNGRVWDDSNRGNLRFQANS